MPLPPETLAPTAPKPPKGGPTAASSPGEVTHGITLRGALLTKAILDCVKRVENRHFRMQQGWYVLHTGAKMSSDKSQHTLLASLVNAPDEKDLPHRAIVGAIEISHALSLEQCSATEPWAFGPVCNVIRSVVRLERPVAHRGALSLWRIDSAVLEDVRAQLQAAPVRVNCLSHLPPPSAAPKTTCVRVPKAAKLPQPPPPVTATLPPAVIATLPPHPMAGALPPAVARECAMEPLTHWPHAAYAAHAHHCVTRSGHKSSDIHRRVLRSSVARLHHRHRPF